MKERQLEMNLTCRHYWVYDSPSGTYSQGYCRYCGEKQKALNVMPKELIIKRAFRKHYTLDKVFNSTSNNGFYLQGTVCYGALDDHTEQFYMDE